MLTLKTKIGDSVLEISAETDKELIQKASFWGEVSAKKACTNCNGTNFGFSYREPVDKETGKKYKYYGLKCNKCGAVLNFGQKLEGGGMFVKYDAKFEKYQASNYNEAQEDSQQDGDIPF